MKKMAILVARYADSKGLKGQGLDVKVIATIKLVAESYELDDDIELNENFLGYKMKFTRDLKTVKVSEEFPIEYDTFEEYVINNF